MKKFQRFYNAGQGDSINAMGSYFEWGPNVVVEPLWTNASAAELLQKYGNLQSFTFVGVDTADPDRVHVFKTVFSSGTKATSLTLEKDGKLGTFRFITSSKDIDRLLRRSKGDR